MTIEIRELVIEARITNGAEPPGDAQTLERLSAAGQHRLIDLIVRRVLEQLREEQRERLE